MLKPYWFLESPIDKEHKYYTLMGHLVKVKETFNNTGFEKHFKELLVIKRDLGSFIKNNEISQRSLGNMTDGEKDEFYKLAEKNTEEIEYIEEICENSIQIIDEFLEKNEETYKKYNSLVEVESYTSTKHDLWDQGFLIIRKKNTESLRIFNWFFSIIKIGKKENLALLMTEMLDPVCPTYINIDDIKKFLKTNIKEFSEKHDCILIGDVSNDVDLETGVEIGKEKSIEIIMNKFTSSST